EVDHELSAVGVEEDHQQDEQQLDVQPSTGESALEDELCSGDHGKECARRHDSGVDPALQQHEPRIAIGLFYLRLLREQVRKVNQRSGPYGYECNMKREGEHTNLLRAAMRVPVVAALVALSGC